MSRPHLPCRHVIEFLADYVDGELSTEERSEFDRHLAVCPPCVAYLDGYRATIRLARETLLPGAEPEIEDVPEELVAAILRSRRR
ncbi:MAG TPA: zf-HC2 domain-containing protein [Myxococcota bacterium]|nr:zf-HC2 domain-containing protein [Myxococcota bacterium]